MKRSSFFAAAGLVALAAAVTLTPLASNDIWVHLAAGREAAREIWSHFRVPQEERFSFTAAGRPLPPHEWLGQLAFYASYSLAAIPGVEGLRLVLVLATLAALALAARVAGTGRGAIAWAALLLLLTVAQRLLERPYLFTYALSGVTLALLASDAKQAEAGGSRKTWLMVPLLVLWGNIHGGLIVGIVLVVATIAGALWPSLRPAAYPSPARLRSNLSRRIRRLALVLVTGVIAAAILNPAGPSLLLLPFELASARVVTEAIYEWRSPLATNYRTSTPFIMTLVWAALLAASAWVARGGRRGPDVAGWRTTGLALGTVFAILGLRQMRSLADFVIVTFPWMAGSLEEAWEVVRARRPSWNALTGGGGAAAGGAAFAAAGLIWLFGYPIWPGTQLRCIPPLLAPWVPVRAADFLLDMRDLPQGARLFNSYNLGGYLAWKLDHRARILFDSRVEAYGKELVEEALSAFADPAAFDRATNRWNPDLLVFCWKYMGASPVLQHVDTSGAWSLVYLDDYTAVYVPEGTHQDLPRVRFVSPAGFNTAGVRPASARQALEEGQRLLSWQPEGIAGALVTASGLLAAGRAAEARDLLEQSVARAPDASPAIWASLASARAALGDGEGAESARRRASELGTAP